MLSISIGLNALSAHGACTAIFVVVAAIIGFLFASIRTLGRISWLAWLGLACILSSSNVSSSLSGSCFSNAAQVLVVTIAVGTQSRPTAAPQHGAWESDYKIVNNPSFTEAVSAVSALVLAFSSTPALFSIASEMREPVYFTRALLVCQGAVTAIYITIGCVVYYFCGSFVATPALGSAGVVVKKVAYGLALPGLIATTTLVIHVGKYCKPCRSRVLC